jgi:PAS domain S-box-containing protein
MSATEALHITKELKPLLPFILVSGTLSEDLAVNILRAGAFDYLAKDRLQRLPQAVTNALANAEAEKEKHEYLNRMLSAERKFRKLIEYSHESVILTDSRLNTRYRSPAATQITGWSDTHMQATSFADLVHPDEQGAFMDMLSKVLSANGSREERVFRFRHARGHYIWIEATFTNMLGDPDVQAIVINYRDVTTRKQAEQMLARSEANLRTIFDNTAIAFVLIDRNFRVLSFNHEAVGRYQVAWGYTLKEGDLIIDNLNATRRSSVIQRFHTVLTGQKVTYEASFPNALNDTVWYHVNMFPVKNESADVEGIIISSEDITYRKKVEIERDKLTSEIARHHKDLEQFTYMVSHNLRAPVAQIKGLAFLLADPSSADNPEFRRCLDSLTIAAENLDTVIRDLNRLLHSGKRPGGALEMVTLSGLVTEIRSMTGKLLDSNNILIHTNFQVDTLYTVRSYLHSILLNLITNSIKYRSAGTPVVIGINSRKENNKILIAYRDNGIGIDMEKHGDRLFGMYERFDMSAEGLGLGLYMIKTQIELLRGRVEVSSAPGQGTEFLIELDDQSDPD